MHSIPSASPLMSVFAAPAETKQGTLPMAPQGSDTSEPAEFLSIFTALLPASGPNLEPVGLSPLLAGYGNGLPLTGANMAVSEGAPSLSVSGQENIEGMALLQQQFGYVISQEPPVDTTAITNSEGQMADTIEAVVAETTEAEATEAEATEAEIAARVSKESEQLGLTQSEIDALTAEQAVLAGQQSSEAAARAVLPSGHEQKLAKQAATLTSTNQVGSTVTDNIKPETALLGDNLTQESTEEGFLKLNLADKGSSQNSPTQQGTTASSIAHLVDNIASTPQTASSNMAHLQTNQINQINQTNALAQATQAKEAEGFASAALSKEVLNMNQDARQWGNTLSQRVVTMITDDVQQARIQLDPPELGSLQVRVQIQNDQATIHVQAQHAHVRDALEANAFRLRDALANDGIQLEDFDVNSGDQQQSQEPMFAQSEGQEQGAAHDGRGGFSSGEEAEDWLVSEEGIQPGSGRVSSVNLLDTFA